VQSSQPPRPSQTSQTSATAASDVSRQVDEALERQRAITGQLDEQIADVRAKISRQQLPQQLHQGTVANRTSTLRWNLVPDERIISPRRSRQSGVSVKSLRAAKRSRSPSRLSLPLADAQNYVAFGGPVPAFTGQQGTVMNPAAGLQAAPLTPGQIPPPTDTQNYQKFSVRDQNFSVPTTAVPLTGVGGPLPSSMQGNTTTDTHIHPHDAPQCTTPGFEGLSTQIPPVPDIQNDLCHSVPAATFTGPDPDSCPLAQGRMERPRSDSRPLPLPQTDTPGRTVLSDPGTTFTGLGTCR